MTFEVAEGARQDLAAVIRFYDAQPTRHGADVRAEFERAAVAIAANPRMYSPVEDEYPGVEAREFLIARFSQRVIYTVEGESDRVIAVVHASRRPGSWHRRLTP